MKIKEKSFRELRGQYVYVGAPELARQLEDFFTEAKQATGVLCYCCLEHEHGLQFEVLCCAAFAEAERKLQLFAGNEAQSVKLAYAAVCELEAVVLPQELPRLAEFQKKVEMLATACVVSTKVEKTRTLRTLDHLRHTERPDEVRVHLVCGDVAEECWVRLEGVSELNICGTLITEPSFDFGVHAGDSIDFYLVKNELGIMCLAMF